jgi:hypothetical protein
MEYIPEEAQTMERLGTRCKVEKRVKANDYVSLRSLSANPTGTAIERITRRTQQLLQDRESCRDWELG